MRLPPPARSAALAGALLAAAALLLGADLLVVRASGHEAQFIPFTVHKDNATAVGMRITNAERHDLVSVQEMFSHAACGQAVPYPRAGEPFPRPVIGTVTFAVLESKDTPGFLRGDPVPVYHIEVRTAPDPANLTFDEGQTPAVLIQSNATAIRHRIVIVCTAVEPIEVRREREGGYVPVAYNVSEPWRFDLPFAQGVDFVYVVRAEDQRDNETYELLAQDLQRGGESWYFWMQFGTVVDETGIVPDRILRIAMLTTLAGAFAFLGISLRRPAPTPVATHTDAALAVAAAGEQHLLRLHRTWTLVGALLVPLLAAATYSLWTARFTPPTRDWHETILWSALALDAALVLLWALTWRRVRADLAAWRKAWTRLDRTSLDDL